MRLASRLLLGSAVVIAIFTLLAATIAASRVRVAVEHLERGELAGDAALVAARWKGRIAPDALADASAGALGGDRRVTLFDLGGRIIGDSQLGPSALGALPTGTLRPELPLTGADGALGSARRLSTVDGTENLFVAVRAPRGIVRIGLPAPTIERVVGAARAAIALAALIALLVTLALTVAFARQISAPIEALTGVAHALAEGDLSRRPALSAPGEVGELAVAVHRMAEQLAARVAALEGSDALMSALIESLHEGVVAVDARRRVVLVNPVGRTLLRLEGRTPFSADSLPRDRLLREALAGALAGRVTTHADVNVGDRTLAVAARPLRDGGAVLALFDLTDLRRLEVVRRDFVANVSHELKTPLTAIRGFAETLAAGGDIAPAEQRQFAEVIHANAQRLQRLVDDLLDLSRIESGRWTPHPDHIDVLTVARDVVAATSDHVPSGGPVIELAIDPRARTAFADPTALAQVLSNLLENAVRYTAPSGTVTIFTEPGEATIAGAGGGGGGGTWVGVRDTGVGISAEHLPRIFERFYRADPARSRAGGGTGLGLAIVRHLTEAHGGRVRAVSAPGHGTVVRAFFPGEQPPGRDELVTG